MSNISQDFINNVGYLYEEINIQQNDFLNEESEYYDEEAAELVEDIISTISISMIYEGYSANAVIGFLADSSEEEIIEKYLSFDENILTESTVSDEYIEEQLEIFDFIISENLLKLGMRAASFLGRVASKPARMKAAGRLLKSNNPKRTAAAYQKLANKNTAKAGFKVNSTDGAPASVRFKNTNDAARAAAMMKPIAKVREIAKGAKTALTSPTAKRIGKGLGVVGLGAAGGYLGAKMGSGDKGSTQDGGRPEPTPPQTPEPATPAPSGTSVGISGGVLKTPIKPKPSQGNAQYRELIKQGKTKEAEKLGKEQWAKNFPELAKKVKPDGTQRGTGQSKMERDAEELRQMQNKSKQRQGSLMGGPEGPGKVDTKAADDALKAEQERQKKRMEQQKNTTMTAKESYEPYDIILEYLLSEGHANTLDEANYIMLEMDEDAIGTIIEQYEYYLLAEEVEEWVDGLVNEGYDLSEYTWDEMFDYYITELNKN